MTVLATKKTDHQIQLDVIAEFERDWRFKPAEIGVEVDAGTVTLTGTVSTLTKLLDAGEIAARVAGVTDVANVLTVKIAHAFAEDDTAIAKKVRTALEWAPEVPDKKIDSIVRNGIVTLKGTVDYSYERYAAADAIKRIGGVTSVINHLALTPTTRPDQAIFDELKGTFERRMPWAAKPMDLTVDEGIVTLMGTITSYLDRREAEAIAWGAHGVKDVVNRLVVRF